MSASLLILERKRIFAHVDSQWPAGLGLLAAGAMLSLFGRSESASAGGEGQLSMAVFALVVIWVGAFVLCYGLCAFRAALFPVLFLFLTVPIPEFLLNHAIVWLQHGSAEVSYVAFQLLGVPVLRSEFVFALPGLTIEVARECSGIRSSLALLIMSLLIGHVVLGSVWKQAILTLATVPLVIVKNGIRIVTLSLLSIYVDPSFLTGSLHRQGGIVFFLIALVLLVPILWLLQTSERTDPMLSLRRSK
jgi:exosortase